MANKRSYEQCVDRAIHAGTPEGDDTPFGHWRWYGTEAVDGTDGPWFSAPVGSQYCQRVGGAGVWHLKMRDTGATSDWGPMVAGTGQDPRAYGAVADGNSRLVSSYFDNLSDAAAAFPNVSGLALTDQIDWAAATEAYAHGPVKWEGTLVINKPLILDGDTRPFMGYGPEKSIVKVTADIEAITVTGDYVDVRDFKVTSAVEVVNNVALHFSGAHYCTALGVFVFASAGGFRGTNVNATHGWTDGARARIDTDCSNITVIGGNLYKNLLDSVGINTVVMGNDALGVRGAIWIQNDIPTTTTFAGGSRQYNGIDIRHNVSAAHSGATIGRSSILDFTLRGNQDMAAKNLLVGIRIDQQQANVGEADDEHAGLYISNRMTGTNNAGGCWGADIHVSKDSYDSLGDPVDGSMVILELGMHKYPALGSIYKNYGIHLHSSTPGGAPNTCTRAGTAIMIEGNAGGSAGEGAWTYFIRCMDGSVAYHGYYTPGTPLFVVDNTGQVGHNVYPDEALHVKGSSHHYMKVEVTGTAYRAGLILQESTSVSAYARWLIYKSETTGAFTIVDNNSGSGPGTILSLGKDSLANSIVTNAGGMLARIASYTTATRPTATAQRLIYDSDKTRLAVANGTAWLEVACGVQSAVNADTSGAALGELETEVNELKATLRAFGMIATA